MQTRVPVELWTNKELKLAYINYMKMLALQDKNTPFTKVSFFKTSGLRNRKRGSWDLRMANISYVRHLHGLPIVKGFSPTVDHVGQPMRKRIEAIMRDLGDLPASPADPRKAARLALEILQQEEHPSEVVKVAMRVLTSCTNEGRGNGST